MHKLDTSAQTSDRHSLVLADQQPVTLVRLGHDSSPTIYLQLAVQILSEHDLALPEPDQLNLIVQSALAVQCLHFDACLHDADKTELHQVALRIYRDVALAALDLLARVVTAPPPFSAVLTDCESIIATLKVDGWERAYVLVS